MQNSLDDPSMQTSSDDPSKQTSSDEPSPTDGTPPEGLGLRTLPKRFLLVYPIIFMLPFPLTLLWQLYSIPHFSESFLATPVGWLLGLHLQATQPIVAWMGRLLTGQTPSFAPTGSGDGLASYLGALLNFFLSVVVTLIWWFRHRAQPISPRVADVCRVLLRYFLAWIMLSYGFSKIFPNQFPAMGPDRLLQPYGDSSPMGLLWTLMGASAGYQMFAGAAEVAGALLLLFRRTTLLGALVIAGVMTNVFAMNVFFDVPVKLYSFHYLLFAAFLAIPDVPRLIGFFVTNTRVEARDLRPFWHESRRWRRALGITKIALIAMLLGTNTYSNIDWMRKGGLWAPPNEYRGIFEVESFEVSALDARKVSEESEPGDEPDGSDEPDTGDESDPEDEPDVVEKSDEPDESDESDQPVTGDKPVAGDPSDQPTVSDDIRWLRIGINPPYSATVQRADGMAIRYRLKLDEEASTIALYDRSLREPTEDPFTIERLDDERIRLSGVFEDVPIIVTLRLDTTERLFQTRGFRWINEYPFNR